MDPTTILTSVIEVAIGIAGFSGIVAALDKGRAEISPEAWFYLRILLGGSDSVIVFSFLPLLLGSAEVTEPYVWVYPSILFLIYTILRNVYLITQNTGSQSWSAINHVAFALMVLSALLCLLNVLVFEEAWPYLTSMVLTLVNAGLAFFALLYRTTRTERHLTCS